MHLSVHIPFFCFCWSGLVIQKVFFAATNSKQIAMFYEIEVERERENKNQSTINGHEESLQV